MIAEARRYLSQLSARRSTDMTRPVERLSGGQRQAVAISRALRWNAEIIIMDEPTAALGVKETAQVLDLIRKLKADGRTVILISHNMRDVVALADRVVIMGAGRKYVDRPIGDLTRRRPRPPDHEPATPRPPEPMRDADHHRHRSRARTTRSRSCSRFAAARRLDLRAITTVAGNVPVAQTDGERAAHLRSRRAGPTSRSMPARRRPLVFPLETAEFVCGPDGLAGADLPPPPARPRPAMRSRRSSRCCAPRRTTASRCARSGR